MDELYQKMTSSLNSDCLEQPSLIIKLCECLAKGKAGEFYYKKLIFLVRFKIVFLDVSTSLCKLAFNFLSGSASKVHLTAPNVEHFVVAQIQQFLEEHFKENVECFQMLYSNLCEIVII